MQSHVLKFILVGDTRVGKSQLSRSYTKKAFDPDSQSTIGLEFSTKTIEFEKCLVKAQLWDSAGHVRYDNMTKAYYRDAFGAALIYDICNRESFESLKSRWREQIRTCGHDGMRLILVGNKLDLVAGDPEQRQVSQEEAMDFAEQEGIDFLETSALTGDNVESLFRRLVLSTAKILPTVKEQLELAALPDGWMIHIPGEEAVIQSPPSRRQSVRKVDISSCSSGSSSEPTFTADPFSVEMGEGGAEPKRRRSSLRLLSAASSPSQVTINNMHVQQRVNSVADTDAGTTMESDSSLAQSFPPQSLLNSPPSVYTRPRVLYMNYWTGLVVEEPPQEPAQPNLLYVAGTVRPRPPETKPPSSDNTRHTPSDDRALTERSSSARTIPIETPQEKKPKRCCCTIM